MARLPRRAVRRRRLGRVPRILLLNALARLVEQHWILYALAIAGVALLLLAPLGPIREAQRLRERLDAMRHEKVVTDMEDIAFAAQRISNHRQELDQLLMRARIAQASLRSSIRTLRLPEAMIALRIVYTTARAIAGLHR